MTMPANRETGNETMIQRFQVNLIRGIGADCLTCAQIKIKFNWNNSVYFIQIHPKFPPSQIYSIHCALPPNFFPFCIGNIQFFLASNISFGNFLLFIIHYYILHTHERKRIEFGVRGLRWSADGGGDRTHSMCHWFRPKIQLNRL